MLDELERIEAPASLAIARALSTAMPAGSQLALASRVEPPLRLGRLRASRRLTELRREELTMTRSEGGELLATLGLELPARHLDLIVARAEGWRGGVLAALAMIDELERQIADIDRELKALGADHRYIPTLMSAPGIAWVLGYTIAAEIGDIHRFGSPAKLVGYTGLCPRVYQSGDTDRRGPLTHAGPRYLRWALMEAATHACRHPVYRDRHQRNKARLGRQRGAKVAQVDVARRPAKAIWHMLTRDQPFAPAGATVALAA